MDQPVPIFLGQGRIGFNAQIHLMHNPTELSRRRRVGYVAGGNGAGFHGLNARLVERIQGRIGRKLAGDHHGFMQAGRYFYEIDGSDFNLCLSK